MKRRAAKNKVYRPPSEHQLKVARKNKITTLFELFTERQQELVDAGQSDRMFDDPISLYLQKKALALETQARVDVGIMHRQDVSPSPLHQKTRKGQEQVLSELAKALTLD